MRILYTQLNKRNQECTEGFFKHTIQDTMRSRMTTVTSPEQAQLVVFFYVYTPDFEFDTGLFERIKRNNIPIVVFDYLECGQQTMTAGQYLQLMQVLGYKYEYGDFVNLPPEFHRMVDAFTELQSQIAVYFKREMPAGLDYATAPFPVRPVDYPINFDDYKPVSKDAYYARPHDVYFNYGLSSVDRFRLHGKILLEAERLGSNIIQTEACEKHFQSTNRVRNFVLLHREWFERLHYSNRNAATLTTVDLYGAGLKCFRNTEGTIDTLSFKEDPSKLLFAYPWIDGDNCISLPVTDNLRLDVDAAFEKMYQYIRGDRQHELYPMYLRSVETNRKYRTPAYLWQYIWPSIQQRLP